MTLNSLEGLYFLTSLRYLRIGENCDLRRNHAAMKMRTLFLLLTFFAFAAPVLAQRGYTEIIRKDGLVISSKWGKARDADGNRKKALLIGIQNNERTAKNYSFNLMFYYEGRLREEGIIAPNCIEGLKSKVGKLTGTYFIPEKFTEEQLSSPDFSFELDALEVEETDACSDD